MTRPQLAAWCLTIGILWWVIGVLLQYVVAPSVGE